MPPTPEKPLTPSDLLHPMLAALMTVIVNYGGTFVLVFHAAKMAGLSADATASWVWSASIGVGLTCILLSWATREPIITAWSTPAAAFLIIALPTIPYSEAIGAYLISALLFIALGLTGYFEKVVKLIPPGIAAGLLAGILLQFGIGAFAAINVEPFLVILMITGYLLLRRFAARYAVVGALLLGLSFLFIQHRIDLSSIELAVAAPVFTSPTFSWNTLLSVALPLFLITLTGQYIPGMLVLRNDGFKTSANPILIFTGLGSFLFAFFGSHAMNIAAITAAICTGKEAHEESEKRWIAGVIAGVLYIVVGIFGVTLAALFMVFPSSFIAALAGIALLGTISSSLSSAIADPASREASLITFLVTAANISFLGIGSAFWGLIIGLAAHFLLTATFPKNNAAPDTADKTLHELDS
ncbi:benzoate/H(+) symporter BenE family transporter [Cellvibrio sp. PSBB023]|uniref:benzoate/H(+) symporter BenE family transporter n=1 Tax=Cellvibrio sp. PSBB023 TaxID=1945512 RepID=UPI00098F19A2|nr:benzoate/H(+) symporter BenE family transporter [Cellvibrio sp. PSBB023]AQT59825.1 benzoate transporter [Cellvibrio sp. PSBB023]